MGFEKESEVEMKEKRKRERGTGQLYLRGSTWWCKYYFHGEPVCVSTSKTDARKAATFLRERLAEVTTGTHTDSRKVTYEEMRASYYSDYQTNERKSLRFDKNGDPHLDKVARLDVFFEGFKASEIDADLIRKFIVDQQGKGKSNGSINRSTSALRRMYHLAKQDGKLRDIPFFPMLTEASPRAGFVEFAQHETLAGELPDYLRTPLALGFFTGMRFSEITGLTWPKIDFLSNTITLKAEETKTGETRTVPIAAPLRALLLAQHSKRQMACPYVCYKVTKGGIAVKLDSFRKAWASGCKRAGLAGLLFHDLRRSAVRNLVRSGVPERVAMSISGHKTRAVFDRYNIVSGTDLADAGRKLENYFEHKTGTGLHQNAATDLPVH